MSTHRPDAESVLYARRCLLTGRRSAVHSERGSERPASRPFVPGMPCCGMCCAHHPSRPHSAERAAGVCCRAFIRSCTGLHCGATCCTASHRMTRRCNRRVLHCNVLWCAANKCSAADAFCADHPSRREGTERAAAHPRRLHGRVHLRLRCAAIAQHRAPTLPTYSCEPLGRGCRARTGPAPVLSTACSAPY